MLSLTKPISEANIVYRRSLGNHQAPPLLQDLLSMSPKSGSICILTCSDARVDPNEYFGLKLGEALVIRNAGGRATDAFRSLEVMGTISPIGLIVVVHHTAAAKAINQILEFDPGLEFMPFFGIYLLQGSFLLLLIADKLQSEASLNVAKACETIVRAHETCVVTLSTEYQRKFSKVMRSALAQVRGRVPEDLGEQQQRRRELLALYRWTKDRTGLAL
ncbi:hypothetical protein MRS44_014071 [Fusarium solani]|uniref:uncharacterized protein n=1 Tax=Fusarium solani TaxID=169388 RepID=UPI0032C40450|nr:hypothetical protein MRS44_014071 [Fusarium solani]